MVQVCAIIRSNKRMIDGANDDEIMSDQAAVADRCRFSGLFFFERHPVVLLPS